MPPRMGLLRRARRVVAIAMCLCLVPVTVSYVAAIAGPSNSSFTIRSFEWLRSNGAARIASQIEDVYYSLAAPATGGPPLRRIPLKRRSAPATAIHPPEIPPVIEPALRDEGVWEPSEAWSPDSPVLIAQFRSDPNYPQMVAGVAWIDTSRTQITLNPGRLEPDVSLPRGPMMVPTSLRPRLLATFNSAFKLEDDGGGFAIAGRTYAPMKPGQATIIGYRNGGVDIETWSGGPDVPPGVRWARQNLPLIVDNGRPGPNLADGSAWGVTVDNAIRVWRSGVGVDAAGNLIYAAANDQTVGSLAQILIRAGAVRAMELDINSYWDSFITYAQPDAGGPSNLLPDMVRSPDRYLTPDDRDFFAVYVH
ncbi:MAG: phosphodiester glycosidase family protein [Solirubrobacteraceae bacterium]